MSRRRSLDAGAAHPALDAPATPEAEFMNKAARDAKDPIVQAEKAEAKTNASVTELLQPFTQELETHRTQPEILRARGKELLQFVFAARGLTKSGKPEDIFAGRKALAAAEKTLKNYQKALIAAKAETLNPAKDYTHDSGKMNELTKAIRGIVPKEFSSIGFWKGEPFGAHLHMSAEADPQSSRETKPTAKAGDTKAADNLDTKRAMLEIEMRKKMAEEVARTQENIIRQETSEAGLTPGERAELEAKKKKPLRLEHDLQPPPDSAIGDIDIEEGPPPVRDEIPSLEPALPEGVEDGRNDWILDEADVDSDTPPRRFDRDELGIDEARLAEHRSPLSDEDLLSDRDAVALAEAPEGFGTEHDRIVAKVKRRMAEREAARLAKTPEHRPEQERILEGSRSSLENLGTDALAKGNLLNTTGLRRSVETDTGSETLSQRIENVKAHLERLEAEYRTIGFTWFNRAKRERKQQIESAITANKDLLQDLARERRADVFERRRRETNLKNEHDVAMNRELKEARRQQRQEASAIVEAPEDEEEESLGEVA